MTRWHLEFFLVVHGTAAPQGSKVTGSRGDGSRFTRESNPRTAGWRQRVTQEAGVEWAGRELLDGPLRIVLRFQRVRPSTHYRKDGSLSAEGRRHPYPDTAPDSSKLLRAIEDSLNKVVIRDDARLVSHQIDKLWGAVERTEIEVYRLEEETIL